VKEKRLRLQEEAEQKLREATEVRCECTHNVQCACCLSPGQLWPSVSAADDFDTNKLSARETQVKAFVSPESQKILAEKGIKDGSTLAERSRAMLARKRKVGCDSV
jgi:hypothetical protein